MKSKVHCLYPYDKTTKFLSPVAASLRNFFKDDYIQHTIYTNNHDHEEALKILKTLNDGELVIFLGHGGSNYLSGATGDLAESMVSEDFAYENPDQVFKYDELINFQNISVLSNKKILCISCYSGEGLGPMAIKNGAISFLGFGDVPTSIEEFKRIQLEASDDEVILFQTELTNILINALLFSLNKKYSFQKLLGAINLFANRRAADVIIQEKGNASRRLIADGLFHFKKGMKVYGDSEKPFM